MTATPGQAAPAMPDSAVLRAAILATEDSGPAPVTWDGEARERLNRIIASWIRIELPPGTPAAATAAAAQRVTAGLAPYVEDEALRLSRNPVAAQEPHAAPEQTASLDAAVQAAAEILFRDYESQYSASHLTWVDFADLARKTVEAAISASAKIVAEHGWTPPQPAPELAAATVLAEVLDFLDGGIPPGDEFALQVAQWRKRGLPA